MAYEQKPGRGSAFKNLKRTKENDSNFSGDVKLPDGTLHWLDVWVNKDKNGDNYLSVKIGNPKKERPAQQERAPVAAKASVGIADDDIPF